MRSLFKKGISTKGENRGYGLYLTKKALDELGGTLEVTSIKGDGAQFYVKIPYEGEEIMIDVLIIEDDPMVAKFNSIYLTKYSWL